MELNDVIIVGSLWLKLIDKEKELYQIEDKTSNFSYIPYMAKSDEKNVIVVVDPFTRAQYKVVVDLDVIITYGNHVSLAVIDKRSDMILFDLETQFEYIHMFSDEDENEVMSKLNELFAPENIRLSSTKHFVRTSLEIKVSKNKYKPIITLTNQTRVRSLFSDAYIEFLRNAIKKHIIYVIKTASYKRKGKRVVIEHELFGKVVWPTLKTKDSSLRIYAAIFSQLSPRFIYNKLEKSSAEGEVKSEKNNNTNNLNKIVDYVI